MSTRRTAPARRTAARAGVAVLLAVAATGGTAAAPPDVCGTLLTGDVTLTADLTCPGPGVVLGPGVTLDLGGHTLRGSGLAAGAAVTGPASGTATVRGGTITDWSIGASATRPGTLEVDRVTVTATLYALVQREGPLRVTDAHVVANHEGARCTGAGRATTQDDCVLRGTTLSDNEVGVVCRYSRCVLERATLTSNRATGVHQIGGHVALVDSLVRGSDTGHNLSGGTTLGERTTYEDNRVGVFQYAAGSDLRDCVFRGNDTAYEAPYADAAAGRDVPHELVRNLFVGNRRAVESDSSELTLRFNVATGNGTGIRASNARQTGWNIGMERR